MSKTPTTKPLKSTPSSAGGTPFRYMAALANDIERRWQAYWEEHATFATPNPGQAGFDRGRPKFYCLDMFPYPSGEGLHVGHPLGYIATDIVCRYKRLRGYSVLHPMGFDAFGLPAEQYAVEHGVHPRVTTERNIANMLRQLKHLGLSYDWSRCLATTDPDYYKWTQWIFLQLYNSYFDAKRHKARPIAELIERLKLQRFAGGPQGTLPPTEGGEGRAWEDLSDTEREAVLSGYRLAYMAEVPVNWCPALGTVLANEEVTSEGRSERGNHPVYRRPLKQWMLRITAYAERLAADLETVDWPEPIKLMQRNWIGRSLGAMIDFPIAGDDERITVFTTRPDTLFGATYMVLAPEHPLVEKTATGEHREAVRQYRREAESRSDVDRMAEAGGGEKTGVPTGASAVNPATGEAIPIWVADYVLMGYGTGAIMAVPAHDLRDWVFARQFGLRLRFVVEPPPGYEPTSEEAALTYEEDGKTHFPFAGEGTSINSANDEVSLEGRPSAEAIRVMTDWLASKGLGRAEVQYKLRDWLFSRQRYWGEPFPIVHAPDGHPVSVQEKALPIELPEMDDFTPEASDHGDPTPPRPPLARAPDEWKLVEHDGVMHERELNTMPQWAGSCWYYLRFIDPKNTARLAGAEAERYWMAGRGVDLYVGGVEHAVLHLLYARFWHKVLYDLGHVSSPEPFGRLFNQGYIQGYAYRDARGVAVPADEVVAASGAPAAEVQDHPDAKFFHKGEPVTQEYGKIGKSLKNVVSPDEICRDYGADTLRLYEMYMGPLEASKPWSTRDIIGPFRFLQRVWRLAVDEQTGELTLCDEPDPKVERHLHRAVAKVERDIERLALNTAIAATIEFVNVATAAGGLTRDQLERFVLILSPFAPHIAEELWSKLGHERSLAYQAWPRYDEAMIVQDQIELPVQLGGKVRARVTVDADAPAKQIEQLVLADEKVKSALAGRNVRKVVVVPGRIVNIVAE
ncbi:MAG: leucine--tRNA ligase [Planctomycetota bacterium]|jgi:leucyl-tRNA synthetase